MSRLGLTSDADDLISDYIINRKDLEKKQGRSFLSNPNRVCTIVSHLAPPLPTKIVF